MKFSRLSVSAWLALVLTLSSAARPQTQPSAADYLRQAEGYMAQNNYQQARTAAQKALALDPRLAEAQAMAGAAEFGLGELETAQKHLQAALQMDPGLLLARRTLGTLYLKQKRTKDARREFERVLESHPQDFVSLCGLGMALLMDNQPSEARQQFEKASVQNPGDPQVLLGILQADLRLNQPSEAAACLAKLDSQLDARDPLRYEIAALLASEGDYELAAQEFQRLCEAEPESYDLHYNLALAYYRAGNGTQASETLRNLLMHGDKAELEVCWAT